MANLLVDSRKKRTYDAIVIGSGASGGWAAKELCDKGLKTLVLERGRDPEASDDIAEGVFPLTGWERASRLSYFLWNTMPDDTLFARATDGTLATDTVLTGEGNRLVFDVRSGEIQTGRGTVVDKADERVAALLPRHGAQQLAREPPIPAGVGPARRIDADPHRSG